MSDDDKPIGKLFTHVYVDRGSPESDDIVFRRRLGGYCINNFGDFTVEISNFIKQETGISVPLTSGRRDWEKLFVENSIHDVLNLITVVWNFFKEGSKNPAHQRKYLIAMFNWRDFVARTFSEQNLSYSLDKECGVHFLVDEEFSHNRVSALRCLDSNRYTGVREAFNASYSYLDATPPDTKAAVRSMFEALEILARMMIDTRNLNKGFVINKLTPLVTNVYSHDPIAVKTITGLFAGFGEWIDAIHNYRHGQGVPEPVEPPLDLAIYIISSGASFLRWLVEVDKKITASSTPAGQGSSQPE